MRQWMRRVRRIAPNDVDTNLWDLAQRHAREPYAGPTEHQPHVSWQLQDLAGSLSRSSRDSELQLAIAGHIAADRASEGELPGAHDVSDLAIKQRAAVRALESAQDGLRSAETSMFDRLYVEASTGVARINGYIAMLNEGRVYEGYEPLKLLDTETVERIVRDAIRPIDPEVE